MTVENAGADQLTPSDRVESVAPVLAAHTKARIDGTLWSRPELGKRDRSLVTIAALVARGESGPLELHSERALDNGVTPAEISETISHLAYYSGWGRAMAAVGPVGEVFARRGVSAEALPEVEPKALPLDEVVEAKRAETVGGQFGAVAPGLVAYTTEYLFRDLWLRPDLAPRDRSLVTVAALIASGQVAQITFHLNRAMDNGLTEEQGAEVITHLAFYAGWPNAMSALPVAKEIFERRRG